MPARFLCRSAEVARPCVAGAPSNQTPVGSADSVRSIQVISQSPFRQEDGFVGKTAQRVRGGTVDQLLLHDIALTAAGRTPNRVATSQRGEQITFGELADRIQHVAMVLSA